MSTDEQIFGLSTDLAPVGNVLVAVDGGNSKTDVAVIDTSGQVIATARGGGFQPHSAGVPGAVDVLAAIVETALERAGRPAVAHLEAYLAGADLPGEEVALENELRRRGWTDSVRVGNDTFALLRAGATAGWGVAVVCGAGINCVGVGPDQRVARWPALGVISGDWGGGSQVGETALWHAIRDEDGRGPATALTPAVAAHFGKETAQDVGLAIHAGKLDQERLLELTPVLLDVATAGDPVACSVISRLADEVAAFAIVALRRLDLLDTEVEVVLGGGVLAARHPLLTAEIGSRVAAVAPRAELVVVDAPPVLGAALLGLDHLTSPPEAYTTLRTAYP